MPDQNKQAPVIMVIAAFAAVYIIWGSTYFFIQKAVYAFPPFFLGAFRFIAAGVLLFCWCALKGERIFVINDIKRNAISGILMLFVGTGAVIWVEQTLPSAITAIILSWAPMWFVLMDKPLWSENFRSKSTIAGIIAGFAGVVLLFKDQLFNVSLSTNYSVIGSLILLIIGSIGWTSGSLYSKYNPATGSAVLNTAWQMLAAGLAFIPGSILRNEWQQIQWENIPADAWLSVAYLAIMGSIVAFTAYIWLLQVRPATQVSTYAYVNPVVAVILGVYFGKETISLSQIAGLAIILGSVLLINMNKYRKANTTT